MRSIVDRFDVRRSRATSLRRARSNASIYVDTAPAGDPTYDPQGTSRPFRPTHKTSAAKKRSSYLDIERRNGTSVDSPIVRVVAALRHNVQYRIEDGNPFEKLRTAGYGGAAILGAACVLVIGASLLSQAFPLSRNDESVQTETASATAESTDSDNASTQMADPTSDDSAATNSTTHDDDTGMPLVEGIADDTMQLYVRAAATCNMPWQILAGVGRVETNHGTSNAPGVKNGENFAGAKGPMQFMQATWNKYGLDANHDGDADIYNSTDAIYSAASYLCANGARNASDIDNALFHYNHSDAYVQLVKDTAAAYYESSYHSPLPISSISNAKVGDPHHDYPADDLPVAQGTPVFAVHRGTVHVVKDGQCGNGIVLTGTDGVRYTYCHASQVHVSEGDTVDAGQLILHSGGQPGTDGAGDATGPHLHFEMSVNGNDVCPQDMLQKWMSGQFASPMNAPSSGCSY
jgi:murein DD-endopeptidase MepM/ murein hydrolase activator NlpD